MDANVSDFIKLLPLLIPILVIQIGMQIYALVDLSRHPREQIRWSNKWIWVVIIIAGEILGPIVYFILGCKEG